MNILITGASSGIGAELARQYADDENTLYLLARREEKLKELRLEIQNKAKQVHLIVVDVADFDLLQTKMQEITDLDMVILNAGISIGHSEEFTPFEDFKKLFDVNLLSNHAILEVLLPKFLEKETAKIVFISSLASLIAMPTSKAYSASKRALNAYAESMRYRYKKDGITVINILPGFIKSELTDKNRFHMPFLLETQEGVKRIKKAIEQNKRVYPFPFRFYILISFVNLLPKYMCEKIIDLVN